METTILISICTSLVTSFVMISSAIAGGVLAVYKHVKKNNK